MIPPKQKPPDRPDDEMVIGQSKKLFNDFELLVIFVASAMSRFHGAIHQRLRRIIKDLATAEDFVAFGRMVMDQNTASREQCKMQNRKYPTSANLRKLCLMVRPREDLPGQSLVEMLGGRTPFHEIQEDGNVLAHETSRPMYTKFVKPALLQFMSDFENDWSFYARKKLSTKNGPDINFDCLRDFFNPDFYEPFIGPLKMYVAFVDMHHSQSDVSRCHHLLLPVSPLLITRETTGLTLFPTTARCSLSRCHNLQSNGCQIW